jgi:hypothetical protein
MFGGGIEKDIHFYGAFDPPAALILQDNTRKCQNQENICIGVRNPLFSANPGGGLLFIEFGKSRLII